MMNRSETGPLPVEDAAGVPLAATE
jgi:hypothetical protein